MAPPLDLFNALNSESLYSRHADVSPIDMRLKPDTSPPSCAPTSQTDSSARPQRQSFDPAFPAYANTIPFILGLRGDVYLERYSPHDFDLSDLL